LEQWLSIHNPKIDHNNPKIDHTNPKIDQKNPQIAPSNLTSSDRAAVVLAMDHEDKQAFFGEMKANEIFETVQVALPKNLTR